MPVKSAQRVQLFQLLVTLLDVRPPIWRRVTVSADTRLDRLHLVLQATMGWKRQHSHRFRLGDIVFCLPDPDAKKVRITDERTVSIGDIIHREGATLGYEYDLGDLWEHELLLERIVQASAADAKPTCLGGDRACPPEDAGGPRGYAHLLAILGNRNHPNYRERKEWVGARYRPEKFDLVAANKRLARIEPVVR